MIELTGTGLYTPNEAAALLHERPAALRRWAFGYARNRAETVVEHPPLINADLPVIEGTRMLSFLDLVELMYIRGFRRAGASWHLVHQAAHVAARLFTAAHPFAMRRFFADPAGIYALLAEEDGAESLVELVGHGQGILSELVTPFLGQLEFDADDVARRWWPLGQRAGVVVDPELAFGAPVVREVGVPAATLTAAYAAEKATGREQAIERVAWFFRIQPRHVEAALDFEQWLQAA